MQYNLLQTLPIIRKKIGYEISESALRVHRQKGNFKPAGIIKSAFFEREEPFYNTKSIEDFVEFYLGQLRSHKVLQWKRKKTGA